MVAVVTGATVHVPPGDDELNVKESPVQICDVPVIVPGSGLTVTGCVAEQPATVKLTIEGLPAFIPVNVPVEVLMVA